MFVFTPIVVVLVYLHVNSLFNVNNIIRMFSIWSADLNGWIMAAQVSESDQIKQVLY